MEMFKLSIVLLKSIFVVGLIFLSFTETTDQLVTDTSNDTGSVYLQPWMR